MRSLSRARATSLAAAAVAAGLGVLLMVVAAHATRLPAGGRAVPVLAGVIGWAFAAVGTVSVWRAPENRTGPLLVAFGLVVELSALISSDTPFLYTLATIADPLAIAVFAHLLVAFPDGRLPGRVAGGVIGALYAVGVAGALVVAILDRDLGDPGCGDCPRNVFLLAHRGALAATALDLQRILGALLAIAAVVLAIRRWRGADGLERRGVAPLVGSAALLLTLGILSAASQDLGAHRDLQQVAQLVFIGAFLSLPVAFAVGLVRGRFFRTALATQLIEGLSDGGDGAALAHWLPEHGTYVDRDGRPFSLPEAGGDRVAVEVTDGGRRVGVLVHDAALAGDPALLGAATGAAALRLANDRLEVELRAQLEALRQSRARVVQAGDDERRRLGRDLHDGAQQRLVSVLIELQLAEERFAATPDQAREHVGRALADARAAVGELRDLAAGIHPAVLSQRGLGAALDTLAARSRVPAELRVDLEDRLPLPIETAAYFVVAEALTNVAKHAEATHVRIAVRRAGGHVVVEVADDGRGGADLAGGSGLRGLGDRVGAVDGTLEVRSTPGSGTIVRVRMPCAS